MPENPGGEKVEGRSDARLVELLADAREQGAHRAVDDAVADPDQGAPEQLGIDLAAEPDPGLGVTLELALEPLDLGRAERRSTHQVRALDPLRVLDQLLELLHDRGQ